jgi:hypothetical protein
LKAILILKQYDTSIPYLVDYKGKKKESGTIRFLIGLCALQTKDYESAIAQFNKIIW